MLRSGRSGDLLDGLLDGNTGQFGPKQSEALLELD
jgi:hypothetical protein